MKCGSVSALLTYLKQVLKHLFASARGGQITALLITLTVGAYLRIWNINHLFNSLHDQEEGVYSIGARLITQGYVPYNDFLLVHPPLYEFVLCAVYDIFGYNFFYGRYLSVAMSLACIFVVYLTCKKLYHSGVGIVAAILFAVSPEMVYWGRNVVPDALGIFLLVLAIYLAVNFIKQGRAYHIFMCGLFLGLAAATKYTFIPAVIAIVVALFLLNMGKHFWNALNFLRKPTFWLTYLGLMAIILALLILIKWALRIEIPIPLIDPIDLTMVNCLTFIVIFVVPLILAIVLMCENPLVKECLSIIWCVKKRKAVNLLVLGTIVGFFTVTCFFWVTIPQPFIHQTFIMQLSQRTNQFPSILSLILATFSSGDFTKMGFFLMLSVIPLIIIILNRRPFRHGDLFLSVAMIVVLVLCQWLYARPRYYVSIYPFLLLGISSFTPSIDVSLLKTKLQSISASIKSKLAAILGLIIIFLGVTVVLLIKYPVYDIGVLHHYASDEEIVYTNTISYLEDAGANKICSPNPIIPALSSNLSTSLNVDYYALGALVSAPPEEVIQREIKQGVDYVVLDYWIRFWRDSWTQEIMQAVRNHARLVAVIPSNSQLDTWIFWLKAPPAGIINNKFDSWINSGSITAPFGWLSIISDGANIAETTEQGVKCVALKITESGIYDTDYYSYAHLLQYIPFPKEQIKIKALPMQITEFVGTSIIGPTIRFSDTEGNTIVLGFSDKVEADEITAHSDGNQKLVLRKAHIGQWQEYTIDLRSYWNEIEWERPETISINIGISNTIYPASADLAFYISEVTTN